MYNDFFNGLFFKFKKNVRKIYSFINLGPFSYLQNLTKAYAIKYKKLVSITGTIYDFDTNDLADGSKIFRFFFLYF